MNDLQIARLRGWFNTYTASFQANNTNDSYVLKNVEIKITHTANVCGHTLGICDSLGFSGKKRKKRNTAEAVALFHDIGRFEQLEKYRTFNDSTSENHAELGIKVLEREKTLTMLPEKEREMILKAIRYHNVKNLPEEKDTDSFLLMKIIRDADKLDILDILTKYYFSEEKESNPALDLDLPENTGYSPAVLEDIMMNRCVDIHHAVTTTDFKLLQMSWVFDINFEYSMKTIRKEKYMEKRMSVMPNTKDVQDACRIVEKWLYR